MFDAYLTCINRLCVARMLSLFCSYLVIRMVRMFLAMSGVDMPNVRWTLQGELFSFLYDNRKIYALFRGTSSGNRRRGIGICMVRNCYSNTRIPVMKDVVRKRVERRCIQAGLVDWEVGI